MRFQKIAQHDIPVSVIHFIIIGKIGRQQIGHIPFRVKNTDTVFSRKIIFDKPYRLQIT